MFFKTTAKRKSFPGLDQEPQERTNAEKNWAQVAAKLQPRQLKTRDKRLIERALRPRTEPLEFDRVAFRVNSNIFKKYKNKDKFYIARMLVKTMGLGATRDRRSLYFDLSLIGNSVVELYVPRPQLEEVKRIIVEKNLQLIDDDRRRLPDFTRVSKEKVKEAMTTRLALLYRRATLVKLKECILKDLPEEEQRTIVEKSKSAANLGQRILADAAFEAEPMDGLAEPEGAGSQ
jgi:hypothetical protein